MLTNVEAWLDRQRDTVIELQRGLVAIPALGPVNGGQGERAKTDYLLEVLRDMGVKDIEEVNAPDDRVECGHRPNVVALVPGQETSRTLWIISHTDIVPPGSLSDWTGSPYQLRVEGDTLYGRGVEDNHLAVVSSLLLAKALVENNIAPPFNLGLLLVSDEETGSRYGLDYVVKTREDLFSQHDLFLVPDFGAPDSTWVEVAEKSILWLKFSVHGKQCHGSTPGEGNNSLVAASALIMKLRALYQRYDAQDDLFEPACSTFEPTKMEANVPNVNTIPGLDIFHLDCRILGQYDLDEVLATIGGYAQEIEQEYGVRVEFEPVQREQATHATPTDADIVVRLLAGIKRVYGTEPRAMGIGGGTVAAYLRRRGYHTAVWGTWTPSAHQPNEYTTIKAHLGDAKVMANVLLQD
jgi:succinyl-diaminopimelate desuccinylase